MLQNEHAFMVSSNRLLYILVILVLEQQLKLTLEKKNYNVSTKNTVMCKHIVAVLQTFQLEHHV